MRQYLANRLQQKPVRAGSCVLMCSLEMDKLNYKIASCLDSCRCKRKKGLVKQPFLTGLRQRSWCFRLLTGACAAASSGWDTWRERVRSAARAGPGGGAAGGGAAGGAAEVCTRHPVCGKPVTGCREHGDRSSGGAVCAVWQVCRTRGQFAWRPGCPTSSGDLPSHHRSVSLETHRCFDGERVGDLWSGRRAGRSVTLQPKSAEEFCSISCSVLQLYSMPFEKSACHQCKEASFSSVSVTLLQEGKEEKGRQEPKAAQEKVSVSLRCVLTCSPRVLHRDVDCLKATYLSRIV